YSLAEKTQQARQDDNIHLAAKGSRIGRKIFEAKNVSKSFDDIKITEDFSYIFTRYEKMGIVGKNGTGKSTFIKMLLGEVEPDSGYFDVGETVSFGYYSQDGLQFDEEMKVIDVVKNIAEVINLGDGHQLTASQFLQHFLFAPEKQHDFVAKLSGGEKRRLYLCTVLIRNPNFLVLDEPTNDLDIVTLNILEEYLTNFKGCVIVISHDRYFMDKVVDHLMVFEGAGVIRNFPGNYSHYREWKEEEDKRVSQEVKIAKVEAKPQTSTKAKIKVKLTYKEKLEFEGLQQEIDDLEKENKELTEKLSSGELSSYDLVESSNRISTLMELIDEKTMRWLELSEYAE
ncbi:MAG: ABC-F family ATP-binding cassette domain-containing protein, partial [Bacteroidales bacterium]|nr:ABC-F family ATP-binding cassette domain-containing protein [Bacteroidales bacterium]